MILLQEESITNITDLPSKIRVSMGTAIVLGLLEGKLDAEPTTAYLMTYKYGKCAANCGFCPQARESKSNAELLSRVTWPCFPTAIVIPALVERTKKKKIKRVCIQALNYPQVFSQLKALVERIRKRSVVPISVSCQPITDADIENLAGAGVSRIGIAIDAATETLFKNIKGKDAGGFYKWDEQFRMLNKSISVFGKGNVSTHIIVGLGEAEREIAEIIQRCVDLGVLPALFAFTPVRGTALEKNSPPSLESYRRMQLARFLIVKGLGRFEQFCFDNEGTLISFGLTKEALNSVIERGEPFRTSGCLDCNRPFYNEKPSGPIYNYPRSLRKSEVEEIKLQFESYLS